MRRAGRAVPGGQLERRYRRLLRVFPSHYRREREEELLAVLLLAAAPGQQRPGLGESLALLNQAARAWGRVTVSTDRAANHVAASVLAVTLPVLLLYPVARTGMDVLTLPWSFLWRNHHDVIAWGLWGLVILAIFAGPAWLPRWLAIAGTVAFAWALLTFWSDGETGAVSTGFCWLLMQITACFLLLSPARLTRGRSVVRKYWWVAVVAIGLLQLSLSQGLPGRAPFVLATVGILALAVGGLRFPIGRVLVLILGTLLAGFVAGHGWWTGIGSIVIFWPTSNRPDPASLVWLVLLPALTWTTLRTVGALVARRQAAVS